MAKANPNPVVPPRPDVSYVGVTKPPPTPERTHSSRGSLRREPPPVPPHPDPEWEAREEMRVRELEEARARAAQMEKTMRWWSDCTANWREKWSKVRNERNKARDECRQLRSKLDSTAKEYSSMKRDNQYLSSQLDSIRKQLEAYQGSEKENASVCSSESHKSAISNAEIAGNSSDNKDSGVACVTSKEKSLGNSDDFVSKLLSRKEKDLESSSSGHSDKSTASRKQKKSPESSPSDDALLQQKIAMLNMKLDEAQRTIQSERKDSESHLKSMEELQADLTALKARYEDLKVSRQESLDQLSRLQELHQDELGRMNSELEDETYSRSNMDLQLADLRKELERLQAENAQEWGKRERLETDKLALERENKRLRHEVEQLEEEAERRGRQQTALLDSDMRTLQLQLAERQKEVGDIRHSHNKLKKVLQDKTAELEHARSRAEQYEQEVKKLRGRIEELKHDLANAEDELDQQSSQTRRLQRTNDELQQQVENMQVQVEHMQSRLRNSTHALTSRAASLKTYDVESTDCASDEDLE